MESFKENYKLLIEKDVYTCKILYNNLYNIRNEFISNYVISNFSFYISHECLKCYNMSHNIRYSCISLYILITPGYHTFIKYFTVYCIYSI